MRCTLRRILMLVTVVTAMIALPATAAFADPPQPTHYRSTVTGSEGDVGDTRLEVLGGDSYLVLHAGDGEEVIVPGYDGEPYLRFAEDGTVSVNVRSTARWLNDARYGGLEVTVPPSADNTAPPQWELVATGGTYAWHDHRIHYMNPVGLPEQVDPSRDEIQELWTWPVAVEVDGRPATFTGRLAWVPGSVPVVAIVVGIVVLATGVLAGRRSPWAATAGLVAAVASLAVGVSALATFGLPPGAQAPLLDVFLPGIGLVAVAAAIAVHRQRPAQAALLAGLGGLPLVVWAGLQWPTLTHPILPSPLPDAVVRSIVAASLGGGVAALVAAVRPLLAKPDVDALLADGR